MTALENGMRLGEIKQTDFGMFCRAAQAALRGPVRCYGDAARPVRRIAVLGGAGEDFAGEALGVGEGHPERAVSSHALAAHEGVLSVARKPEPRVHELGQLFRDPFEVAWSRGCVEIEAAVAVGHHDGKVIDLRKGLDHREADPLVGVRAEAVQEV